MTSSLRWLAETTDDRGAAARVGREGSDLVAEWIGIARLVASRDGKRVRFTPEEGAEPRGLEKIKSGVVTLLLRHLDGKLGLHGAAVGVHGRAALFVGGSGQGKSTLAAYACTHHGAEFIADDAVGIDRDGDRWTAIPLERDHWLHDDARRALGFVVDDDASGAKSPEPPVGRAEAPRPLGLVVLLAYADVATPRVVPLRGLDALAAIVPLVVRFVIDEPEAQRRELDLLADLVARVPVVRLERPRALSDLGRSLDAVLAVLSKGDSDT